MAPSGAQRGWGPPRNGRRARRAGRAEDTARDSGPGAGSRSAADRRQAPVPPSGGPAVCPSTDRAPPKPPLEDLGAEVRQGTYRRISCLVRNVKSWKAKRKGFSEPPGGHARSAAGPRIRLPRPGSPAQARAHTPRDRRPAHLVLRQQLLGQATARAPHRRAARTVQPTCLGAPATFPLPPSGRVTAPSPRQPPLGPPPPGPPPP